MASERERKASLAMGLARKKNINKEGSEQSCRERGEREREREREYCLLAFVPYQFQDQDQ